MKIKLWGVRGSLPAPMDGQEFGRRIVTALDLARKALVKNPKLTTDEILSSIPPEISGLVGGDTTCVEVTSGDSVLVLDLGTGARRLGYDLVARKFKGELNILMTHTHWDHIQGWPFFAPAYNPELNITFHSAFADCEERFSVQQRFSYFPVPFESLPSKRSFHLFQPGEQFTIGPFTVSTRTLIHPGNSTAYRIEANGKVFIFATDTEFYGNDVDEKLREYQDFFEGADLVIMDGQYSDEESAKRIGWGHTSTRMALQAAIRWKVKSLVLTHHEPAHTDEGIYELFRKTLEYAKGIKDASTIDVKLALQGDVYEL